MLDVALDPDLLREITPASVPALARDPDRWLMSAAAAATEASAPGGDDRHLHAHVADGTVAHDAAIRSFCLWFDAPFTWDTLSASLEVLTTLRGPDLLRVKGIVNVEGETGPVAIHGVQHIFHPPVRLGHWRDAERRSRIVFIVRNIPLASVEALFGAVGMLERPDQPKEHSA